MIFMRELRWRQIAGILDATLVLYLVYLMGKHLVAGETELFLLATIANGIWCISCVISNLLLGSFKPQESPESEGQ